MSGKRPAHKALLLLALGALACNDSPVDPMEGPLPQAEMAASAMPAPTASSCTRSWASGIDDYWTDPTKWTPEGVPDFLDLVCISAAGTYTVTLPTAATVQQIVLGSASGANATLDFVAPGSVDDPAVLRTFHVVIRNSGTLRIASAGANMISGVTLTNEGTLDLDNVCACLGIGAIAFLDIDQTGRAEVEAPAKLFGNLFHVRGPRATIVTTGAGVTELVGANGEATLEFSGGLIAGETQLKVGNLIWTGGTIDTVNSYTSVVEVDGGSITLDSNHRARTGRLDAVTDADGLDVTLGVLGVDETLSIGALANHTVRMHTPHAAAVNRGNLTIAANGTNPIELGPFGFVNGGTFKAWGSGTLEFRGPSTEFVNRGDLLSSYGSLRFVDAGATLRNEGNIPLVSGPSVTMDANTTFDAIRGSTLGLPLVLNGGTLQGEGTVGDVTVIGGVVAPGAPHGELDAGSVTFDGTSRLVVQIGDTSMNAYGRLNVAGGVRFDGLLVLSTRGGAGLGRCGQVITPIRHHQVRPSGVFAQVLGGRFGNSNWRVQYTPDSLMLAGFPTTSNPLAIDVDTIAVVEGGARVPVRLCLTGGVPASDVTLKPVSRGGQAQPNAAVLFPAEAWGLPQTLSISAVEDAIVEDSVHHDTLDFTFAPASGGAGSPSYSGPAGSTIAVSVTDNDGDADLDLFALHTSVSASDGNPFEAEFRITNHGPTASTGSTLTLDPGVAASFSFMSDYNMTCTDTGGVLRCVVPGLASGSTIDVSVTYDATAPGTATIQASLGGRQPDGNALNNQTVVQVVLN